jgi:Protein of unknown function (Hypoth_ymh)
MLSTSVYRHLSELMSQVHHVVDGVNARVASDEIDLRTATAKQAASKLKNMISHETAQSLRDGDPFGSLAKHLSWLSKFYREGKHDRYEPDIRDVLDRDLPGILGLVERWASDFIDPRLEAAISESWNAQQYASVVQDAFICLEHILRDIGDIEPSRGMSGDRLVTAVLGPNSSRRADALSDSYIGQLTSGEINGAYFLIKGAFLLLRNSVAHRKINYTANEAEEIVHLINLCLRLLRTKRLIIPFGVDLAIPISPEARARLLDLD